MAYSRKRRKETENQLLLLIESSDESDLERSGNDESDFEHSDDDEELGGVSEEENTVEDFKGIDWTEDVKNELLTPDKELVFNTGPAHDLPVGSSPLQYFKLFFPDDVCDLVQININKFAELEQKRKKMVDPHWQPIENILEMWRFLCIILICGIVRVPRLQDYWSGSDILGNQAVKKLMSRNRFLKILQYFHIAVSDESFNFTQTVEPIMDDIRERFLNHFKPPRELLIEEAFIKNKESLRILQNSPLKASKSGLKVWTLSSPGGYIFNFDIYAGKKDKKERSKNGLKLGHNVVNRLLMPINSKGHHIYLDRFFTSVPLMLDIFKGGNRACGPIRSDRQCMPKELKTLKLKEPGESKHFQCIQCPDLLCCVWCDKEQHCVLSTNSKMELIKVHFKRGVYSLHVHCPSIIRKYNAYMGNVERAPPTRSNCNSLGISSKWWRYLFLFMFDSSLNNAFIVYTLTNMPQNRSPKRFMVFKMDMIDEIARCMLGNSLRNPGLTLNLRTDTSEPDSSNPAISSTPLIHEKVRIKGRKQTCKRCSRLKRKTAANYYVQSSYMCNVCQICLCTSCFGVYHSEKQMLFSEGLKTENYGSSVLTTMTS